MTIQQCKYVLAIVKTGSFTEAARQLFVAQSSLSISIKSLEQELNIKIFKRSGNGVFLTEEGSEFVRYASRICQDSDFVERRYSAGAVQEKLFIATQHYDFVADIFCAYLNTVSADRFKLAIKEIKTHNVIYEVEMAYSDIGIIAIKDRDYDIMKRYLANKRLSFTPLLKAYPHVFFRKEHPLSQSENLQISDLKSYPYVSYEQGEHNSAFFTEELTEIADVDKHIQISDRATLMNLLLVTDAYTVGTGIMPSALNQGNIVSIPLDTDDFYHIGYLLNEDRKISPATYQFIETMKESMKKYHAEVQK